LLCRYVWAFIIGLTFITLEGFRWSTGMWDKFDTPSWLVWVMGYGLVVVVSIVTAIVISIGLTKE
jgi:hypothetical protein